MYVYIRDFYEEHCKNVLFILKINYLLNMKGINKFYQINLNIF